MRPGLAVRAGWEAIIKRDGGIMVPELAETGSTSGERLMTYADDIGAGKLTTEAAIKKAQAVITEVTTSK